MRSPGTDGQAVRSGKNKGRQRDGPHKRAVPTRSQKGIRAVA